MGFEAPYLLFGLVGVVIPVLIHLYLRNQARRVPMDAVTWLVLSGTGTAVRLRTIHALLITTRIVLIAVLVVLFARPFVRMTSAVGGGVDHPVAFAAVVDDSMSMRLRSDGVSAWSRARAQWMAALAELPPESDVFVVTAGAPAQVHTMGRQGWGREAVLQGVEEIRPGWASTDLSGAVRKALDALRSVSTREKRLLIASDFFDHGLADFPDLSELVGIEVRTVDVGRGVMVQNRGVVDIATTPAPEVSAIHVRVRVTVANESPDVLDELLTVRIGAVTTAARMACGAAERCTHEFLIGAEEGSTFGQVSLPPDDLPEDDVRWFTLAPRKRNAVLLVSGAPSRQDEQGESFFLSRALGLRAEGGPGFTITTVRPEEMSPLHLSAVSTVGLLNVARLTGEQVQALEAFVASGGGLLVSVGDNVDAVTWNTLLSGLLPASVRDRITLESAVRTDYPTIAWADPEHPAVRLLLPGSGGLSGVEVRGYVLMEDFRRAGTRVLATLGNGAPLLVERKVGQGMVVMLLTTVDRDWTDLPLRPVFAPFVRQVFAYLTTVSGGLGQNAMTVGESRRVDVPVDRERVVVVPPSGKSSTFSDSGHFVDTRVPGVYRVESYEAGRTAPVHEDAFVVNPDATETLLRRDGPEIEQLVSLPVGSGGADDRPRTRKVSIGSPLLLACLCLLLIEAYLRGKA